MHPTRQHSQLADSPRPNPTNNLLLSTNQSNSLWELKTKGSNFPSQIRHRKCPLSLDSINNPASPIERLVVEGKKGF